MRAMPLKPLWVHHYQPDTPLPGWLRWHPFVVWIDCGAHGGVTSLSVVLPNGLYLHAKQGDYLVRSAIGEISLLTPRMYQAYYQPVTEDTHDEQPATPPATIPAADAARRRDAAEAGVGSA